MTESPSQREQVAAAITTWQAADDLTDADGPYDDADALVDALAEHGLQILPIAGDYAG